MSAVEGNRSKTAPMDRQTSPTVSDGLQLEQVPPANQTCTRACPVCGGSLYEIRHKLHCQRCHTIVETCCEGGRG